MRIILVLIFMLACAVSYGQEAKTPTKEITKTETSKKDRKTARLYKRANSRIKKDLEFRTKTITKLA